MDDAILNLDLTPNELVRYMHKLHRAIAIYKENNFSFIIERSDPFFYKKRRLLNTLKTHLISVSVQHTIFASVPAYPSATNKLMVAC